MSTKPKDIVARLETSLGAISFHEAVFTSLIQEAIVEIPGVNKIELRQMFGLLKGQKIAIEQGDATDEVNLSVSVTLQGPIQAVETCSQIQKRLKFELEQYLGIKVSDIVLTVEDILFD